MSLATAGDACSMAEEDLPRICCLLDLPPECLQQCWPARKVHTGIQVCWSLRRHLLRKVTSEGGSVPSIELFARPLAFSTPNLCKLQLYQFERPIILSLARAGPHAAMAVQFAIANRFNPLLLRSLDLSCCRISNKEISGLCAAVRSCSLLEQLYMAYNGLEWEGVRDISQHLLPHLPALTSLDLSHNGCGGWTHKPNAHTSAPPWLHDHAGLAEGGSQGEQEFLMRDWRYTDMLTRSPPRRDRRPASRHEHGSPHGGTVDCRSPVGAASQGEAHDMRNGQEEHLCSEHRQCGIDFPGIVALSRSLMRASPSTGIKILNLGCNRLTDACVALVAGALLGTLRGREGEDGDGGDTGEGGGVACGGLSASCEVLRLQCNELTASGAASLSAALPSSRITALDLTDNVIASEGVACIATALAVCGGRMHYLGLGSNSIGDSGMSHLAAALPACVRLRHLDLSDNRIVDEGATHLAAVLGACRALRYLSLCSNQVGDQGAARIADAMLSIRTSVAAGDSAPRHCPGQEAFTASCFADRPDRVGGTSPDTGGTLNTDGTSPGGMSLEVLDIRGNRVGDVCSKRLIAGAPSCCCVRVRF